MVEKQEAANAKQQKQIEAVTAGLQKVSAQLEASKPAPHWVTIRKTARVPRTRTRYHGRARAQGIYETDIGSTDSAIILHALAEDLINVGAHKQL